jgi:hypothetical protein
MQSLNELTFLCVQMAIAELDLYEKKNETLLVCAKS